MLHMIRKVSKPYLHLLSATIFILVGICFMVFAEFPNSHRLDYDLVASAIFVSAVLQLLAYVKKSRT